VALHYADPGSSALPAAIARPPAAGGKGDGGPQRFAGVVLVAAFPSLPELLKTYRIGGVLPVLSPLRPYPYLTSLLEKRVVDTWATGARMAALVEAAGRGGVGVGVRVTVLHARDDGDISWKLGEEVFKGMERVMMGEEGVVRTDERRSVLGRERVTRGAVVYRAVEDWAGSAERVVELEVVRYGGEFGAVSYSPMQRFGEGWMAGLDVYKITLTGTGHNRIVTFAPVALAVTRAFESV